MKWMTLLLALLFFAKADAIIKIVAAESTYGSVAKQLGGSRVLVTNIIQQPNQDPHLFNTTTSTIKAIHDADLIILNGAGYDPWMERLMANHKARIILLAKLVGVKPGENPHIWFWPRTMPLLARTLVRNLQELDPAHHEEFDQQLQQFTHESQALSEKIAMLKKRFDHTPVIATESVLNYLAESIGLEIHAKDFQINIMNDVPPTISQTKEFENDLRFHRVKLFIYNKQVKNPVTERLRVIAEQEKIPVLGVSEIIPQGFSYSQWMMQILDELDRSLSETSPTSIRSPSPPVGEGARRADEGDK